MGLGSRFRVWGLQRRGRIEGFHESCSVRFTVQGSGAGA